MRKYSKIDDIREIRKGYELEEAVRRLDTWYTSHKEENFFNNIFNKFPMNGIVLEVGGGTGFQGMIISKHTQGLYIHSDYSFSLCLAAKKKRLFTVQMNGLNLAFPNQSIDQIIAIELSTIIRSESLRIFQFKEFSKVIKKNGYLFLVTSLRLFIKKGHCINKNDTKNLRKLGFRKVKVIYWGIIPGRFWKKSNSFIFGIIERLLSQANIGKRKIVILQKI